MSEPIEDYVTNERADSVARVFGVVLLAAGLGLAYAVWPTGITESALASVTFGALLRAVGSIAIAVGALVVAVMFWL